MVWSNAKNFSNDLMDLDSQAWTINVDPDQATVPEVAVWSGSVLFVILPAAFGHILNKTNRLMTKPTKWSVRPAKTRISLGICPVWSESLQCAQWVAEDPMFLYADSEDSDQTGRMPRLIWVFAGRKGHFVGFVMRQLKWRCSNQEKSQQ